jgi:hypothetical protein
MQWPAVANQLYQLADFLYNGQANLTKRNFDDPGVHFNAFEARSTNLYGLRCRQTPSFPRVHHSPAPARRQR